MMCSKGPISGPRVNVAAELVRPSGLLFVSVSHLHWIGCGCPHMPHTNNEDQVAMWCSEATVLILDLKSAMLVLR